MRLPPTLGGRFDNDAEFTAQLFVDWCAEHGAATHYIKLARRRLDS
jgi:hypothetical protein